MQLPVIYSTLGRNDKRRVREHYVILQDGYCFYCKDLLHESPPKTVLMKKIDWSLFPIGFLKHPIHLHHSHDTGLTLGAVHAYCNAVLWQYHEE